MTTIEHHPYPDPQLAELVEEAGRDLQAIEPLLNAFIAAGQVGELPSSFQRSDEQCEASYTLARRLCDEGHFQHAAPLAAQLVMLRPADVRYSFIAATCMQRLGLLVQALQIYGLCASSPNASSVVFYRVGECLLGLKETERAIQAMEHAFDLARNEDEGRVVQDMVTRALDRLKSGNVTAAAK